MTSAKARCIEEEMKYREWRVCPIWFCLKTTFNNFTGKVKSEFVVDEKTKLPLTIQDEKKPTDEAFETATETIYYTYHSTYEEAANQIEQSKNI